ncbi:hypothetical protein Tco_0365333 [Tanacetum coccineum]
MIKKCSNLTSAISDETIANPNAQIVGDDMVRVQVPRYMAWLDYDEYVDSLSTMDNEVGVTSLESTTQTLPSFEEYTPPMTYPKEVEETLGTPMEVEPLEETQLEDLGLNTCNHDIPLSSREVPSFDEPKPQPNPLPNCPSLDVSLGEERGPEPPIKPHSPDGFSMKEVDHLTNHTPPSPHVASFHPKAIPDEYLLKFHNVADAKSLWEVIKSRFGGNVESKKMQKNVHGAPISKEYVNQRFLRSLPSSWNQIALILRNKPDIDEIDIDDLYNNLKVYEDELKRSSGVSTAGGINQVPSTRCAHDVAYSFPAQPTTSSQLENEDF